MPDGQPGARSPSALATLPSPVAALVMDFDGVFTDNRVLVDENGVESVFCHRGDGLGIEMLRDAGLAMLVISKERNPVVMARCRKLKLPCFGSVDGKLPVLERFCQERNIDLDQVIYLGNDVNDLECLEAAGCGVVVADAHSQVLPAAQLVLHNDGGRGAIRELADLILEKLQDTGKTDQETGQKRHTA